MTRWLLALCLPLLAGCNCGSRPPDDAAPFLKGSEPTSGAMGVGLDAGFTLEFTEAMAPESVVLTLSPPTELGAPSLDTAGTTLIVAPKGQLAPGTTYALKVEGTDLAGNALEGVTTIAFSTSNVDLEPPTLHASVPSADAGDVSVRSPLAFTFSEPMALESLAVTASPLLELGDPSWDPDGRLVTFTPDAGLAPMTDYTLEVQASDLAGNALQGPRTVRFTTSGPPDLTRPTVTDVSPAANATGVPNNTLLTLNFSEAMRPTETAAAITFEQNGTLLSTCDGRWQWNSARTIASCQPAMTLMFSTPHRLTLSAAAQDAAGNALVPYAATFTTGAGADLSPPSVTSTMPADLATGVERTALIEVRFSEAMDTAASQAAFSCSSGAALTGTVAWLDGNKTLRFTPSALLASGANVSCTVQGGTNGARDAAGNRLGTARSFSFRVLRQASLVAPTVADLDGVVGVNGFAYPTSPTGTVGDNASDYATRSFVTFDLAGLPSDTRRVLSATLTVTAVSVTGTFQSMLPLVLDHMEPGSVSGYGRAQLSSTPWTGALASGARSLSVTSQLRDDFAARVARGNRSQFRLRFTFDTNANGNADTLTVAMSEWSVATARPSLVVTFEFP